MSGQLTGKVRRIGAPAAVLAGTIVAAMVATPVAAGASTSGAQHASHAAHSVSKPKHKKKKHHPKPKPKVVIDTPTHIKVVKVTSSSFSVSVPTRAKSFKLFASSNHHSLGVVELMSRTKASGSGSAIAHVSPLQHSKTVSVTKLPFSTAPYYYRVEAFSGTHHRWGAILGTVGLLPAAPTDVVATSSGSGLSLAWASGAATGYRITQATDAAMSQNVTTYTTSGSDTTFTPYGLTDGTAYYFTVQSLNGSSASAPSAVVTQTPTTSMQDVRVMSYNIMEGTTAGTTEGGSTLASWADRKAGVVNLIQQGDPDVVAIQEAAAWVGPATDKIRQIDDLTSALGGAYTLADTEVPPTHTGYFRTGVYILYNPTTFSAVGAGGHFDLGNTTGATHWAAYQVLQNISSGAQFLFVAPHLIVGNGATYDAERQAQTTSMIEQANAIAQPLGIPVVYAGDFNSDTDPAGHAFDGPRGVMQAADYADSYDVAQNRTNPQYDSANRNLRTPPAFYQHIDYVFVPQGVAVKDWVNELDLTGGKFVGVLPSDHNPIYADLEIPYTPATSGGGGPTPPSS